MHKFEGHTEKLKHMILSDDQKILYSCSLDGTIRMWNTINGKEIKIFKSISDNVFHVILSKDQKTIYSCGNDGFIQIWDIESGEQTEKL